MKVGNQSNISFKSNSQEDELKTEMLLAYANTSDAQLQSIANKKAALQYVNDPTRKITNTVGNMIPIADSFIAGARTSGSLGTKTVTGLDTAKDWVVFIVVTNLVNKLLGKIIKKSPKLQKFTEEHPTTVNVASAIGVTAIGSSAVYGANRFLRGLVNKAAQYEYAANNTTRPVKKTLSAKSGKLIAGIYNGIASFVDKKLPGRDFLYKGLKHFENFANSKAGKFTGAAILLGITTLIVKNFMDIHRAKKTSDETYRRLEQGRFLAAKELANQVQAQKANDEIAMDSEIDYENEDEKVNKKNNDKDIARVIELSNHKLTGF